MLASLRNKLILTFVAISIIGTLISAVMTGGPDSNFIATGPGITEPFEPFALRWSWQNVSAESAVLYGAVGIGSSRGGAV